MEAEWFRQLEDIHNRYLAGEDVYTDCLNYYRNTRGSIPFISGRFRSHIVGIMNLCYGGYLHNPSDSDFHLNRNLEDCRAALKKFKKGTAVGWVGYTCRHINFKNRHLAPRFRNEIPYLVTREEIFEAIEKSKSMRNRRDVIVSLTSIAWRIDYSFKGSEHEELKKLVRRAMKRPKPIVSDVDFTRQVPQETKPRKQKTASELLLEEDRGKSDV